MSTLHDHKESQAPGPVGKRPILDLDAISEKLRGKKGPHYWRSLEEIAETPEFQAWVDDEFPNRRDLAGLDRRTFLKFMGASLALAGLAGCRGVFLPEEKLIPYVKQPEELTIGKPLYYATAMPVRGYGVGVLVEQREGRPIKLEGNPQHAMSNGAIDIQTQAQILNFYDPDRSASVLNQGNISTWEEFTQVVRDALGAQMAKHGAGLRILTETVTSPSLSAAIGDFIKAYPSAKWHVYEPVNRDAERVASQLAFNTLYDSVYDISDAKVIVSLDSDFLQGRPDSLALARQYADGRRDPLGTGTMNRMYVIESSMTITGAAADHRWPVKPSEVRGFAAALATAIGLQAPSSSATVPAGAISAIAKDLLANAGSCAVIPGDGATPEVHLLAYAINQKLGNIGKTVKLIAPVEGNPGSRAEGLATLTKDLQAGTVDTVIMIGGNPVFTAPNDIPFKEALSKAKLKVHLSEIDSETASLCDWTLPLAHPLEAWGDLRAADGTVSLVQPLIEPLRGNEVRSPIEFISLLMNAPKPGYDLLRAFYAKLDEKAFRRALHDGFVAGSQSAPINPPHVNFAALSSLPQTPSSDIEVKFVPCPKIADGRFSNNGWLRELPHPVTKITWDNVIEIGPQMAQQLKIESGNMLEIEGNGGTIAGPAWIQPGQPDGVVTVTLGYGRINGGVVATADEATGYSAYPIRRSNGMGWGAVTSIKNNGGDFRFANVQMHHAMNGRDIVRSAPLAKVLAAKDRHEAFKFAEEEEHTWEKNSEYPDPIFEFNGEQWGMTIDLNTCIGCNACVTACQAENNIPVVGKDQVARGREMHWLRVDRYYGPNEETEADETPAALANPEVVYQPLMCVQCEKAPCEPVCPVAATVHSHDGLNQMVYNRCVGTRYCSDNCPYKVRRFNFLNYTDNQLQFADEDKIPLLRLMNNPDVTVRGRGVMEKCTYCVQRISDARIEAKKAGLPIADGSILTACQQACPTKTITFGNINDPKSKVAKLRDFKSNPRSYMVLEDLNTRPRTAHLARLRNPNPEIKA